MRTPACPTPRPVRALLPFFAAVVSLAAPAARAGSLECIEGPEIIVEAQAPCEPFVTTVGLQNVGSETLIIRAIDLSCGCTVATVDRHELAPGDIAALTVTIQTIIKTGDRFDERIVVRTDDGGTLTIPVVGEHPWCFRLNRREISFGDYDIGGELPTATLAVELHPEASPRSVTVAPVTQRVVVQALPGSPDYPRAVLFAVSPGADEIGHFEDRVRLVLGSEDIGSLRVSWVATSPLVSVRDAPMYFAPVRRGESLTRVVSVHLAATVSAWTAQVVGEGFHGGWSGWREVGQPTGEVAIEVRPPRRGALEGLLKLELRQQNGDVSRVAVPLIGYGY